MQKLIAERETNLKDDASRDSLTGLYNHGAVMEYLRRTAEKVSDSSLCFAMIDIDHFKKVNDEYGHQAGDAVLITLAGLLKSLGARGRPGGTLRRRGIRRGAPRMDRNRQRGVLRTAEGANLPRGISPTAAARYPSPPVSDGPASMWATRWNQRRSSKKRIRRSTARRRTVGIGWRESRASNAWHGLGRYS